MRVGERFLAGWDAFDRLASPAAARELVAGLSRGSRAAAARRSARLPPTGLHGDLKLANVAPARRRPGRAHRLADDDASRRSRSSSAGSSSRTRASLPLEPGRGPGALPRGRRAGRRANRCALGAPWPDGPSAAGSAHRSTLPPRGLEPTIGDWDAQLDLTWIVGLLLRGWRKGLDAEAGVVLGSGIAATDDLAWWSTRARRGGGATALTLPYPSADTSAEEPSHAQDRPEPARASSPAAYPFSKVVEANGFVFVAGQVGDAPGGHGAVPGGIEAETRAMLDNVGRLLEAVGLDYGDVVKATVYLRDFGDFAAMNAVYREYFPTEPPTRATVGVTALAADFSVEIEVLAVR